MFLLTEQYRRGRWGTLQVQNQGRPRATRTQCDELDQRIEKVVGKWQKDLSLCGCRSCVGYSLIM